MLVALFLIRDLTWNLFHLNRIANFCLNRIKWQIASVQIKSWELLNHDLNQITDATDTYTASPVSVLLEGTADHQRSSATLVLPSSSSRRPSQLWRRGRVSLVVCSVNWSVPTVNVICLSGLYSALSSSSLAAILNG